MTPKYKWFWQHESNGQIIEFVQELVFWAAFVTFMIWAITGTLP